MCLAYSAASNSGNTQSTHRRAFNQFPRRCAMLKNYYWLCKRTMTSWGEQKWYAVQSKQFGERIASAYLTRLGITTFLPETREEQNVCGTDRWLVKPLFSGYFFALFSLNQSYDAVRYAPRILGVLGSGAVPLPVPEEIIESIRSRVQADGFVRLDRTEVKSGDQVALTGGCFAGWMGRVERECDDQKRVLILLESLHQSWLVVDKRFAEVAISAK